MKKNKLQEFADKSLEKYDNQVLREQIVKESVRDNELVIDNRKRNWIITISVFVIVALLAFGIYFLCPKSPEEKHYILDNQITTNINVDDVAASISHVTIKEPLVSFCQKTEDKIYDETLFYKITFTSSDSTEKLDLVIVINLEYNYEFLHEKYDKQDSTFGMRYVEQYTENDGIYMFNCAGEFIVDETVVYAQYEGLGLEPQSNFIDFLQQCIEIH